MGPCQHSFVEIDHEIFSALILSLPVIQERQLSVSGKRMYTNTIHCLEDYDYPGVGLGGSVGWTSITGDQEVVGSSPAGSGSILL